MVSTNTNNSANENGADGSSNDVGLPAQAGGGVATSSTSSERTSFAAEAQRSSMVMNSTLLNILDQREEDSGRGNNEDDDDIGAIVASAKMKVSNGKEVNQDQHNDNVVKMEEQEKNERELAEVQGGGNGKKYAMMDVDKKSDKKQEASQDDATIVGAIAVTNVSDSSSKDNVASDSDGANLDVDGKTQSSTTTEPTTNTFSYNDLTSPSSLAVQDSGGATSPAEHVPGRYLPPPGAYQLHADGRLTRLRSGRANAPDPEQAPPLVEESGTSPTVLHAETSADNSGSGLIEAHTVDDVVEVHARPIEWWTPRKTILIVGFSLAILAVIVGISVGAVNNNKSAEDAETGMYEPTLPPEERLQAIRDILLEHGYKKTTTLMVNGTDDIHKLDNSTTAAAVNETISGETFYVNGSSALTLDDPTSAQFLALQWLALEDEYRVSIDDIEHLLQRYSLAVLYFATGGNTTWIDPFEFLSNDHECSWSGALQCESSSEYDSIAGGSNDSNNEGNESFSSSTAAGTVTGIELQANELVGQLPTVELSFLSNLKYLDVGRNGLSGALPMNLPPQLTYLELYKNEFTGTIPNDYSQMTDLEYLRASFNQLSGALPNDLGLLTKLTILNMEENILTGSFPDSIWNLSRLEIFNFDTQKEMTGTISSKIGNFHNLTVLLVNSLNGLTGTFTHL